MTDLINPLEKLKTVNLDDIKDEALQDSVRIAHGIYDQRADLTVSEISTYTRLHEKVQAHFRKMKEQQEEEANKAEQQARLQQEEAEKQVREQAEQQALQAAASEAENMVLPHQAFLTENKLTLQSLSVSLRKSINAVEMLRKKYVKSPTDTRMKEAAIKASNNVIAKIKDFMSKQTEQEKAQAAAAAKAAEDAEKAKVEAENAKAAEEEAARKAAEEAEAKVKAEADEKANAEAEIKRKSEYDSDPINTILPGLF